MNARETLERTEIDFFGALGADGADAILAALKEAGYAVTPVEPSNDMIASATMDGLRSARNGDSIDKQIGVIWSAMLAASQEQEEG